MAKLGAFGNFLTEAALQNAQTSSQTQGRANVRNIIDLDPLNALDPGVAEGMLLAGASDISGPLDEEPVESAETKRREDEKPKPTTTGGAKTSEQDKLQETLEVFFDERFGNFKNILAALTGAKSMSSGDA